MTPRSMFNLASAALSAALLASVVPSAALADSNGHHHNGHENNRNGGLIIYFTRHAEKQTVTIKGLEKPPVYTTNEAGDFIVSDDQSGTSKGSLLEQVCGTSKCAEELSKKGDMRAMLLADWMGDRHITGKIDAVYATHKTRTQQTVTPIATAAGKTVVNVVAGGTELNPESTSPSECATLQAIEDSIEAGHDTIVIAGHSGTLYDIMGTGVSGCELEHNIVNSTGLGLNTGNTVKPADSDGDLDRFPKNADDGKVANFGDLWKVAIRPDGTAVFKYRKLLDFLKLGTVETVR